MSDVDKFFEGDKEEYMELVRNSEIKKGDRVRVTRKARTKELGWNNSWPEEMDSYVGTTFVVKHEDTGRGVDAGWYRFPIFVLEKVDE